MPQSAEISTKSEYSQLRTKYSNISANNLSKLINMSELVSQFREITQSNLTELEIIQILEVSTIFIMY